MCEAECMQCPVCQRRSARRPCPALGRDICPVCCGSKRLVEINCPADCGYLMSGQAHPAAIVRRQQEADLTLVTALLGGLSGAQRELALAVLGFVVTAASDGLVRVRDEDVVEMAEAYASTLRTAQRGVIYEHRPQSLVAQRLTTDVQAFLEQRRREHPERGFEQDVATGLERIARTFREAARITGVAPPRGSVAGSGTSPQTPCLDAVGRILRAAETAARAEGRGAGATAVASGPRLIQP